MTSLSFGQATEKMPSKNELNETKYVSNPVPEDFLINGFTLKLHCNPSFYKNSIVTITNVDSIKPSISITHIDGFGNLGKTSTFPISSRDSLDRLEGILLAYHFIKSTSSLDNYFGLTGDITDGITFYGDLITPNDKREIQFHSGSTIRDKKNGELITEIFRIWNKNVTSLEELNYLHSSLME